MKSATVKQIEPPETSIEVDMDSLHILPLCIMPLYTTGLKQARLIKNMHSNRLSKSTRTPKPAAAKSNRMRSSVISIGKVRRSWRTNG